MSPQPLRRAEFLRVAKEQLGKPYIWGANGPDSFDCSGLVLHAYRAAGAGGVPDMKCTGLVDLCRIQGALTPVRTADLPMAEILPGSLLFYGRAVDAASHVMIAIGDGSVIGASGGGRGTVRPVSGACVKYQPKPDYRPDLVAVGELPFFLNP